MSYLATVNLVPSTGPAKEIMERVAAWSFQRFETIVHSVDDALAIVNNALPGSKIRFWHADLFTHNDINRVVDSGAVIEWRHVPGIPPTISYVAEELMHSETLSYNVRTLDNIVTITIHHTVGWGAGSNLDNAKAIAAGHVTRRGWAGIGYHYLICPNGEILNTNDLETASAHSAGENMEAIGVAFGGDFRYETPTDAAIGAGSALVQSLYDLLPNHVVVIPHKRMEGAATACPGVKDLEYWLKLVAGQIQWI